MRYFKELNEKGYVYTLGAGDALDGIEITQAEYETLLVETNAKMRYTEQVYHHKINIADVPADWSEEIQYRVNEMIEAFGEIDPDQISDAEALAIITGGVDA